MYKLKIGLEIHLQLLTKAKAFSSSNSKSFNEKPNSLVNEIDLGYPGTLPIYDEEYVILGLIVAFILHMKIAKTLSFDRKHYLYPDLPKGYQITQFFNPLGKNGHVDLKNKKVSISDIHLEEDTAKRIYLQDKVLVDYNRCGKPLLEIVTKPCFESSKEVIEFLTWLRVEMVNASITRGILAEGSMRCDVNLTMYDPNTLFSTQRVEIKNLNSFKSIEDAIEYEKKLHIDALKNNRKTILQTKSFDEQTRQTTIMRVKTKVDQYFYIPDPNLYPINISEDLLNRARQRIPLSIIDLKHQMNIDYQIHNEVINGIVNNRHLLQLFKSCYFDESLHQKKQLKESIKLIKHVANWLSKIPNDILIQLDVFDNVLDVLNGTDLFLIYEAVKKSEISIKNINAILKDWVSLKKVNTILKKYKIKKTIDKDSLVVMINKVLSENTSFIKANIETRKERVTKKLMGQVMKETKGQASPQLVMKIITQGLKKYF